MNKISIKKIMELREQRDGAEREKYACELSGVPFQEKHFRSRMSRPLEFDLIEPLPRQKQDDMVYIITLLTSIPEEMLHSIINGTFRTDNGTTFEKEYGVELE